MFGYAHGSISHGKYFFCAISSNKDLKCWKIEQNSTKQVDVPQEMKQGAAQISVGQQTICGIS
jgi:hypothetical protein